MPAKKICLVQKFNLKKRSLKKNLDFGPQNELFKRSAISEKSLDEKGLVCECMVAYLIKPFCNHVSLSTAEGSIFV